MSSGNFTAFYAALVGLSAAPLDLSSDPAMALAIQKREADRTAERVDRFTNLLEDLEVNRARRVSDRVRARAVLKAAQDAIKAFHRAVDFFNETGNPFPLLKETGVPACGYHRYLPSEMTSKFNVLSSDEKAKLQTIPDGWTPKTSINDPETTAV